MKTLLVPVDFTDTSGNAVNFAIEWSKRFDYKRIILLKSFYDSVFDDVAVSTEYGNVSQDYRMKERQEVKTQLNVLCKNVAAQVGEDVKVITAVCEMPLLRAILEVIESEKPELVVVGSDNYSYSSESFIAGNVIGIAKASPVRVLIVPATYTYQLVQQALVPCDFNTVHSLDKVNSLRSSPKWGDAKLLVLNVDAKERYASPDEKFREAENSLHHYLKNFRHQIHYSNDPNILNGILNFANAHQVQLIIALPGRHSFLYYLAHKSISEAIYRNAQVPVLILK